MTAQTCDLFRLVLVYTSLATVIGCATAPRVDPYVALVHTLVSDETVYVRGIIGRRDGQLVATLGGSVVHAYWGASGTPPSGEACFAGQLRFVPPAWDAPPLALLADGVVNPSLCSRGAAEVLGSVGSSARARCESLDLVPGRPGIYMCTVGGRGLELHTLAGETSRFDAAVGGSVEVDIAVRAGVLAATLAS